MKGCRCIPCGRSRLRTFAQADCIEPLERFLTLLILGTLSLGIPAGCIGGEAVMRRRTSQGGLIELRGDRGRALEDSKRLRSNHCGAQGSWVEYEEDRLVGAPQNTTSTSGLSVPGRPPEAGVSASDEIATGEERLLRYHCGSAPEEASDDGVSSDAQSPVRMLGESENLEAGTNR